MPKPKFKLISLISLILFCAGIVFVSISTFYPSGKTSGDEKDLAIENALYSRADFFGSKAIVPFPTKDARQRLGLVLEEYPDAPEIYRTLSELDERLENYTQAEENLQKYAELQTDKSEAFQELAAFYNRRGAFEKEAAVFEKMLDLAPPEKRAQYFSDLINLAKKHKLEKYLQPAFYQQIIEQDPSVFPILEQFLDKLIEEKNYPEALKFLHENKEKFPDKLAFFIRKEVSLLVTLNKKKEAEQIFIDSFDPFWPNDITEQFYSFLDENDRFRQYGKELLKKFNENPADFDAAVRLIHFEKYDGDPIEKIILKLEKARAEKNIEWTPDELLTVSLFLIADGNADLASRFLYTLFLKKEAEKGGELRAKILYQLFVILSDAGDERVALTKGDLNFYRDIAAADTHPGITTGILSLIFANENPSLELENKERSAVKLFNRAAAYRIFTEYKNEFPKTPQLAQMYLDIIRLYTAEKDLKIAGETLADFEERFRNSADYPLIALKLADAYKIAGNFEKERGIYQKILDHLGSTKDSNIPLILVYEQTQTDKETRDKLTDSADSFQFNEGIQIPNTDKTETDYYNSTQRSYTDFISQTEPAVYYELVLNRMVASLAKEKKTPEILTFYNNEIAKYQDEPGLYEHFLAWLSQTNFTDEQLRVYQNALKQFQNKTWRDKLARFFIRNEQKEEFEKFSTDLIEKFSDQETREYLSEFIDSKSGAKPESFEGRLYLALYKKAHERFPHNQTFVAGLLKYYGEQKLFEDRRNLLAEYYFEMPQIREVFLTDLAKTGELRNYLNKAAEKTAANDNLETLPYRLFRADASARLSNFEQAVEAYRELNRLYPNDPEFSERLISFTRSFGQTDRKMLEESAGISEKRADFLPVSAEYRTRAGELQAELGDYKNASEQWQKLIPTAAGEPQTYLDTATVFWDYYQFDDALRVIKELRRELNDDTLYAFQAGAIYEAKNNTENAISEYVAALGASSAEDSGYFRDVSRAKNRLVQLRGRRDFGGKINKAFQTARKNPAQILNYVHYLVKSGQKPEANRILQTEIERNDSEEFLLEAKMHFSNLENIEGERSTLRRLAETSENRKSAISYQLQLAENYSASEDNRKTVGILNSLVRKYPTNYGVLNEADSFFWRIGKRGNSLQILREAIGRGRGNYKYIFSRKLASRLISIERLPAAEQILLRLHLEDKKDTEVFDELTNIYVHENKPEDLRRIAEETLAELKRQDLESREINYQTADLRLRLINAFTRLSDYKSAVAQHIEIINRQPDDEENLEEAVKYVTRYGGAGTLLDYYKDLAAVAYKNYRWYFVLARIYEADQQFEKASENYLLAIHNQPENVELYQSLSVVYEKNGKFEPALEAVEKIVELSGESFDLIKRKIEILEKAGRRAEADQERAKLPEEKKPVEKNLPEVFAEAENLRNVETAKSIENYRIAFDKLLADPTQNGFVSSDIQGYVETVRREDPLDEIAKRLWSLREKLIAEAESADAAEIGKIRGLISTLDGAFSESVGNLARQKATGNELTTLFHDIRNRIGTTGAKSDKYQTFALLQNLVAKCGFASLEEKILLARKDEDFALGNAENYHNSLNNLLKFYESNGQIGRVLEILEGESALNKPESSFGFQQKIAGIARLLGDRDKEFEALKNYFDSPQKDLSNNDETIKRYLELLYSKGEDGRNSLAELAELNTPHQLQLINFLIAKNEKDMAHQAIAGSGFSNVWKSARNAQVSLALSEFEEDKQNYFQTALQFAPIGDLIRYAPDQENRLAGDNWFKMTYQYGKWLKFTNNEKTAVNYLPAMIENRPKDANEQLNLGNFYLEKKDFVRALEHLEIAREMNPNYKPLWAKLGLAFFQNGETEKADQIWRQIIDDENPSVEDCKLYLNTLKEYGQAAKARQNLGPIIARYLKEKEMPEADLSGLIQNLSETFRTPGEKTVYLNDLSNIAPENLLIPKLVIEKSLVEPGDPGVFYQKIIKESSPLDSWTNDSDFTTLLEDSFDTEETEIKLDRQNNFKVGEPVSEKLQWQKEYLEYLFEQGDLSKERQLIAEIEKSLKEKYARPVWLRSANFQMEIAGGVSPQTFNKMKMFIGISDFAEANTINPPDQVRLNETLKILYKNKQTAVGRDLRRAFYARLLALEQYSGANFKGLADAEFETGQTENALKILNLLVNLSSEETRDAALGQLDSLPFIKEFAPEKTGLFETEAAYSVNLSDSLRIAAETATGFGQMEPAIEFRRKLAETSPDDSMNLIELARLLAHKDDFDETLKPLATVIADRNATRTERWQAVFVAGQILSDKSDAWQKMSDALPELAEKDPELSNALEAIWFSNNGNYQAAVQILENPEFNSPHTQFLKAIIAKNFSQDETALNAFIDVQKSNFENSEAFEFIEERPVMQIIRLYLKTGKPLSALKLAEFAVASGSNDNFEIDPALSNRQFHILTEQTSLNQRNKYLELLSLLSQAAEETGDLPKALEFEQFRSNLLSDENSKARLEELKRKIAGQEDQPKIDLRVDENIF